MPLLQILGENRPLHHFHGEPQMLYREKSAILDAPRNRTLVQHRLVKQLKIDFTVGYVASAPEVPVLYCMAL